jgi:hypothetical protein
MVLIALINFRTIDGIFFPHAYMQPNDHTDDKWLVCREHMIVGIIPFPLIIVQPNYP